MVTRQQEKDFTVEMSGIVNKYIDKEKLKKMNSKIKINEISSNEEMYTDPRAFQIEYLALEQEYLVVFVKNIPHEEVLKMDADEFKAIYVECVKQTGHATASSFRGWTPKSISADKPIGRMAAAKSGKAAKK